MNAFALIPSREQAMLAFGKLKKGRTPDVRECDWNSMMDIGGTKVNSMFVRSGVDDCNDALYAASSYYLCHDQRTNSRSAAEYCLMDKFSMRVARDKCRPVTTAQQWLDVATAFRLDAIIPVGDGGFSVEVLIANAVLSGCMYAKLVDPAIYGEAFKMAHEFGIPLSHDNAYLPGRRVGVVACCEHYAAMPGVTGEHSNKATETFIHPRAMPPDFVGTSFGFNDIMDGTPFSNDAWPVGIICGGDHERVRQTLLEAGKNQTYLQYGHQTKVD